MTLTEPMSIRIKIIGTGIITETEFVNSRRELLYFVEVAN